MRAHGLRHKKQEMSQLCVLASLSLTFDPGENDGGECVCVCSRGIPFNQAQQLSPSPGFRLCGLFVGGGNFEDILPL